MLAWRGCGLGWGGCQGPVHICQVAAALAGSPQPWPGTHQRFRGGKGGQCSDRTRNVFPLQGQCGAPRGASFMGCRRLEGCGAGCGGG
eukprot:11428783-Alexandrium_andersonii.AAC.1